MASINIHAKVHLDELARQIAQQHQETEVLEFLGDLDELMASWDFTNKASALFVSRGLDLHRNDDKTIPVARTALARVAEFVRQSRLQPHVQRDSPIFTVWTDPTAHCAPLEAGDLDMVLELAASALSREEK